MKEYQVGLSTPNEYGIRPLRPTVVITVQARNIPSAVKKAKRECKDGLPVFVNEISLE